MIGVPKDTRTRYQGVYARHRVRLRDRERRRVQLLALLLGQGVGSGERQTRKTRSFASPTEARNARADWNMLRAGIVPASSTMRVEKAIEAFLAAIEAGSALNKHGRRYKPSAIRDLRGALEITVEDASA